MGGHAIPAYERRSHVGNYEKVLQDGLLCACCVRPLPQGKRGRHECGWKSEIVKCFMLINPLHAGLTQSENITEKTFKLCSECHGLLDKFAMLKRKTAAKFTYLGESPLEHVRHGVRFHDLELRSGGKEWKECARVACLCCNRQLASLSSLRVHQKEGRCKHGCPECKANMQPKDQRESKAEHNPSGKTSTSGSNDKHIDSSTLCDKSDKNTSKVNIPYEDRSKNQNNEFNLTIGTDKGISKDNITVDRSKQPKKEFNQTNHVDKEITSTSGSNEKHINSSTQCDKSDKDTSQVNIPYEDRSKNQNNEFNHTIGTDKGISKDNITVDRSKQPQKESNQSNHVDKEKTSTSGSNEKHINSSTQCDKSDKDTSKVNIPNEEHSKNQNNESNHTIGTDKGISKDNITVDRHKHPYKESNQSNHVNKEKNIMSDIISNQKCGSKISNGNDKNSQNHKSSECLESEDSNNTKTKQKHPGVVDLSDNTDKKNNTDKPLTEGSYRNLNHTSNQNNESINNEPKKRQCKDETSPNVRSTDHNSESKKYNGMDKDPIEKTNKINLEYANYNRKQNLSDNATDKINFEKETQEKNNSNSNSESIQSNPLNSEVGKGDENNFHKIRRLKKLQNKIKERKEQTILKRKSIISLRYPNSWFTAIKLPWNNESNSTIGADKEIRKCNATGDDSKHPNKEYYHYNHDQKEKNIIGDISSDSKDKVGIRNYNDTSKQNLKLSGYIEKTKEIRPRVLGISDNTLADKQNNPDKTVQMPESSCRNHNNEFNQNNEKEEKSPDVSTYMHNNESHKESDMDKDPIQKTNKINMEFANLDCKENISDNATNKIHLEKETQEKNNSNSDSESITTHQFTSGIGKGDENNLDKIRRLKKFKNKIKERKEQMMLKRKSIIPLRYPNSWFPAIKMPWKVIIQSDILVSSKTTLKASENHSSIHYINKSTEKKYLEMPSISSTVNDNAVFNNSNENISPLNFKIQCRKSSCKASESRSIIMQGTCNIEYDSKNSNKVDFCNNNDKNKQKHASTESIQAEGSNKTQIILSDNHREMDTFKFDRITLADKQNNTDKTLSDNSTRNQINKSNQHDQTRNEEDKLSPEECNRNLNHKYKEANKSENYQIKDENKVSDGKNKQNHALNPSNQDEQESYNKLLYDHRKTENHKMYGSYSCEKDTLCTRALPNDERKQKRYISSQPKIGNSNQDSSPDVRGNIYNSKPHKDNDMDIALIQTTKQLDKDLEHFDSNQNQCNNATNKDYIENESKENRSSEIVPFESNQSTVADKQNNTDKIQIKGSCRNQNKDSNQDNQITKNNNGEDTLPLEDRSMNLNNISNEVYRSEKDRSKEKYKIGDTGQKIKKSLNQSKTARRKWKKRSNSIRKGENELNPSDSSDKDQLCKKTPPNDEKKKTKYKMSQFKMENSMDDSTSKISSNIHNSHSNANNDMDIEKTENLCKNATKKEQDVEKGVKENISSNLDDEDIRKNKLQESKEVDNDKSNQNCKLAGSMQTAVIKKNKIILGDHPRGKNTCESDRSNSKTQSNQTADKMAVDEKVHNILQTNKINVCSSTSNKNARNTIEITKQTVCNHNESDLNDSDVATLTDSQLERNLEGIVGHSPLPSETVLRQECSDASTMLKILNEGRVLRDANQIDSQRGQVITSALDLSGAKKRRRNSSLSSEDGIKKHHCRNDNVKGSQKESASSEEDLDLVLRLESDDSQGSSIQNFKDSMTTKESVPLNVMMNNRKVMLELNRTDSVSVVKTENINENENRAERVDDDVIIISSDDDNSSETLVYALTDLDIITDEIHSNQNNEITVNNNTMLENEDINKSDQEKIRSVIKTEVCNNNAQESPLPVAVQVEPSLDRNEKRTAKSLKRSERSKSCGSQPFTSSTQPRINVRSISDLISSEPDTNLTQWGSLQQPPRSETGVKRPAKILNRSERSKSCGVHQFQSSTQSHINVRRLSDLMPSAPEKKTTDWLSLQQPPRPPMLQHPSQLLTFSRLRPPIPQQYQQLSSHQPQSMQQHLQSSTHQPLTSPYTQLPAQHRQIPSQQPQLWTQHGYKTPTPHTQIPLHHQSQQPLLLSQNSQRPSHHPLHQQLLSQNVQMPSQHLQQPLRHRPQLPLLLSQNLQQSSQHLESPSYLPRHSQLQNRLTLQEKMLSHHLQQESKTNSPRTEVPSCNNRPQMGGSDVRRWPYARNPSQLRPPYRRSSVDKFDSTMHYRNRSPEPLATTSRIPTIDAQSRTNESLTSGNISDAANVIGNPSHRHIGTPHSHNNSNSQLPYYRPTPNNSQRPDGNRSQSSDGARDRPDSNRTQTSDGARERPDSNRSQSSDTTRERPDSDRSQTSDGTLKALDDFLRLLNNR